MKRVLVFRALVFRALVFRVLVFLVLVFQGPVSQKSRNFTGHFRVSQFLLYLKNGDDLIRQTSQLFFFLLP